MPLRVLPLTCRTLMGRAVCSDVERLQLIDDGRAKIFRTEGTLDWASGAVCDDSCENNLVP